MKKAKKIGLVSAFCTAMLSLTACAQPESVYGPPPAESSLNAGGSSEIECVYGPPPTDESEYDLSSAEDVQEVYGPPAAEESVSEDESSVYEAPPEESAFAPDENLPAVVYGPPPAMEDNSPKVVPE